MWRTFILIISIELVISYFLIKRLISMTQAELLQALQDAKAEADKAKAEIVQKIADLETAIGNAGNTTPEVDAALADLKSSIQGVDDIVPDVT